MPLTQDPSNPQIHCKVPADVYDGIKAVRAEQGESMTIAVRSLLREALRARGLLS